VIGRIAIVGSGRMGSALHRALKKTHGHVGGPFGRGFDGRGFDVVILAVPDAQIAIAAAAISEEAIVGHCAGSLGCDVLGDHESFAMHPLMTVTAEGASFEGAGAAIDGTTPRALATAEAIALMLGLRPWRIRDADRSAYHAAASIASNFLVTLEDAAEALLATAGGSREILGPLVRAAVENWLTHGGPAALTGPIARGDEGTVARQRAAVSSRMPELLAVWDALVGRTRVLAARAHDEH
jgi:predicted short-subunit dehydrogenase-like oxidoreductase (DUF2520 family)